MPYAYEISDMPHPCPFCGYHWPQCVCGIYCLGCGDALLLNDEGLCAWCMADRHEAMMAWRTSYAAWRETYEVTHGHCPCDCDHPQPFFNNEGVLICGACWFQDGKICVMVPCTPETCRDG